MTAPTVVTTVVASATTTSKRQRNMETQDGGALIEWEEGRRGRWGLGTFQAVEPPLKGVRLLVSHNESIAGHGD